MIFQNQKLKLDLKSLFLLIYLLIHVTKNMGKFEFINYRILFIIRINIIRNHIYLIRFIDLNYGIFESSFVGRPKEQTFKELICLPLVRD